MTLPFQDITIGAVDGWLPVADAIVKATVLLLLTALTALALRRAAAATRHLVWTIGLACALVLPACSMALPRWQLPIVSIATSADTPADRAGDLAESQPLPKLRRPSEAPRADSQIAADTAPGAASEPASSSTPQITWGALLIAIWMAGAGLVLARLLLGIVAVRWFSHRTEAVSDAAWLPLARELADHIGVPSDLSFLRSPAATMPMACGIFKPSVLMPAEADTWPVDRLRIVLLHELAHVKRRDCLTHALSQVACAMYWFNPLVWMAAKRMRAERERACDDLVLAAGTRGSEYADQLLEIARVMRSGRFPGLLAGATLAMAHRSQLEGRLIAILDPRVPRSGVSRLGSAGATMLAVIALLPLASLQPWAYTVLPANEEAGRAQQPAATEPANAPGVQAAQATERTQPSPHVAVAPQPAPLPLPAVQHGLVTPPLPPVPAPGIVQSAVEGAIQGSAEAIAEAARDAIAEVSGQDPEGRKADPKLVAALTAALKDSDREVREAAMHALVQLRDPSIFEPLVQALKDASADIREQAASGLGQLRDRRAIEPLAAVLKDTNAGVREQAVFALGQLRAAETAPVLTLALKDENASVREQAAFALGQIRDPKAIDALATALKDSNPSVREQAAFALGQLRDRRALPALSAAVTDDNSSVREQAVFALGQLRDPAAVDILVTALRDSSPDIRENAAFALGQIRDRRAVSALTAALKDANAEVRHNAAFGLGQLRDRSAVEALVVAMKDSSAEVRSQVAFALGQLGDPRAIDALTAALKDSSSEVRQQAAFALGQLAR
jgi:HEAT repeat protein/beta-lactamase regulating signal transducer with metallopeptidase domain